MVREPIDETKYISELPKRTDEEPVPQDSIAAVTAVLQTLADEINLAEFKRSTRKPEPDAQQGLEQLVAAEIDQPLEPLMP